MEGFNRLMYLLFILNKLQKYFLDRLKVSVCSTAKAELIKLIPIKIKAMPDFIIGEKYLLLFIYFIYSIVNFDDRGG